jgi:hypothetical protein
MSLSPSSSASPLRGLLALHLTGAALGAGGVLLTRALSGSFAPGLHWGIRSGTVVVLSGLALGGWFAEWRRRVSSHDPVTQIGFGTLLVAIPMAAGLAALSAGASPAGLVFRSGLLMSATLWAVWSPLRQLVDEATRELAGVGRAGAAAEPQASAPPVAIVSSSSGSSAVNNPETLPPDELVQTWSRTVTEGTESIEAEVAARFAAGERQVLIHIPIQPVLSASPAVECEPVDGSDLDLSVDLVTPFGVRIRATRGGDAKAPACMAVAVLMSAETAVSDAA